MSSSSTTIDGPSPEIRSDLDIFELQELQFDDVETPSFRSPLSHTSVNIYEEINPNDDGVNPWLRDLTEASLPEVHGTVHVPSGDGVPWWKTMMSYIGPGVLVAVGYMDPG